MDCTVLSDYNVTLKMTITAERSSPLRTNSETFLYPESIRLTETTGVQLRPETYIEGSIALSLQCSKPLKSFDKNRA